MPNVIFTRPSGGGGGTSADELVKVSSNDTTPDYLGLKLVAGYNIALTELNDGAYETLEISFTGSITDELIKVTSNDSTADYLFPKLSAGYGINITELNDGSYEQAEISVDSSILVDELVKVSSNDTTAGYLNGKLEPAVGIGSNEDNDGANETFRIWSFADVNVIDIANTPPASPSDGDVYLVGTVPTGSFTGHSNEIAEYSNSAWRFYSPLEGYALWVNDEDYVYRYYGSQWIRENIWHEDTSAHYTYIGEDDIPTKFFAQDKGILVSTFDETSDGTTNFSGCGACRSGGGIAANGILYKIGQNGVLTFNIADPKNPSLISYTPGTAGSNLSYTFTIKSIGDYLYVHTYWTEVAGIRISNGPDNVSLFRCSTGGVAAQGNNTQFDIASNKLYVVGAGSSNDLLVILDISRPESTEILSTTQLLGGASRITSCVYHRGYVYAVSQNLGKLVSVYVGDPTAPIVKSTITDTTNMPSPFYIYPFGQWLYIVNANNTTTITVVDISDPNNPSVYASYGLSPSANITSAVGVDGNIMYIGVQNGIIAVDISDVDNIRKLWEMNDLPYIPNGEIATYGNYIYVGSGYYDGTNYHDVLYTIEVPGMYSPHILSESISTGDIEVRNDISIGDNATIYGSLEVGGQGIITTDLNVIGDLRFNINVELANTISDLIYNRSGVIDTNGDLLVLGVGQYLQIFGIGNPGNPYLLSSVNVAAGAFNTVHLIIKNNNVFLYGSDNKLRIYDITNTSSPGLISTITSGSYHSIVNQVFYIEGNYVYIIDYTNSKLEIYNISDISNPVLVGSLTDTTNLNGPTTVNVKDGYAYIYSFGNKTMNVVDVSDPTSPTWVAASSAYGGGNYAPYSHINGNFLYQCVERSGVIAYDISNPSSISVIAYTSPGDFNRSWGFSGGYYFTIGYPWVLYVFDISDPTNMQTITTTSDLGGSYGYGYSNIVSHGPYIYHLNRYGNQLVIWKLSSLNIAALEIPVNLHARDIHTEYLDSARNISSASIDVGNGGIHSEGPICIGDNPAYFKKEIFYDAQASSIIGDYPAAYLTSGADGYIAGYVPYDLIKLDKVYAVIIPTSTSSYNIDIDVQYAANGEAYNTNTSSTSLTPSLTVNNITEIDITSLFTALSALDYIGVKVTNNSSGSEFYLLGIKLVYH